MYALTTTLFLLSASALLVVQAGTVPKDQESEAVKISNNGFSLQTGVEGYLANVDTLKVERSNLLTQLEKFVKADIYTKMTLVKNAFIASKGLFLTAVFKIFAGAKILSFIFLWGVAATHAVCKFTSLCSFSTNLPDINKEDIKARIVNLARPYMSDETLDYTLRMARTAMDSYVSAQEYI